VRAAFNRVFPEVPIELQSLASEGVLAELEQRRTGGTLPAMGRLPEPEVQAATGQVIPLEELIAAAELPAIDQRVGPYRWDALFASGLDRQRRLYGLPYASASQAVAVNLSLLQRAGIELASIERWTWGDVARLAQQIGRPEQPLMALAGLRSVGSARLLHLVTRAFGGGFVAGRYVDSQKPTPLRLASAETLAGVRLFSELTRVGIIQATAASDDERAALQRFTSGRAICLPTTTWELAELRAALAQRGEQLASIPLPAGPAGSHTTIETAVAGLYLAARSGGRLLSAYELLAFLASDVGSRLFCLLSGAMPGSEALMREPPWAGEPVYAGFHFGFLTADRAAPRWMGLAAQQVLQTTVANLLPDLLTGRLLPEELVRQWEQALLAALDRQGVRLPR
jgi:ABC-type glycerol-3-phosphate transport system substrate-binding protein